MQHLTANILEFGGAEFGGAKVIALTVAALRQSHAATETEPEQKENPGLEALKGCSAMDFGGGKGGGGGMMAGRRNVKLPPEVHPH